MVVAYIQLRTVLTTFVDAEELEYTMPSLSEKVRLSGSRGQDRTHIPTEELAWQPTT